MIWIDVDADVVLPVNVAALIADSDFKTRQESVTYDQAGMDLVWNFVTTAGVSTQTEVTPASASDYTWNNVGNGMYSINIPDTAGGGLVSNDAEGHGWFTGFATGILPWVGPVFGFRAAGLNALLIDNPFSATRGLTGTAVPAVAADGAFGLPISDAGGLALDDRMISAAATANLEDMFDGTGYMHDTAPATQLQLAGVAGGLAIPQPAESGTVTTGGEGATDYTDTQSHGGDSWTITDAGSGLEAWMGFDIGVATARPVALHFHGYFDDQGGPDKELYIQAYNFNAYPDGISASGWETIETLTNGSANEDHNPVLTVNYVGDPSGSDSGIVRIRFLASGAESGNIFYVDHCLVYYSNALRTDSDGYVLLSGGTGTGQVALTSGAVVTDAASRTASKATGFSTHNAAAVKTAIEQSGSSLAQILADTAELQTDDVPGLIAALNNISSANVLTQINAAIDTAISELSQAAPTATPSLRTGLMLLYMALRNKLIVQTSGTDALEIHNDAGTKIAKKLIADDEDDYTEDKMTSGA